MSLLLYLRVAQRPDHYEGLTSTPYRVFWKVRNGGQNAVDSKQLRGEITESTNGSMMHTETTAYKGTHYVECYIVKTVSSSPPTDRR